MVTITRSLFKHPPLEKTTVCTPTFVLSSSPFTKFDPASRQSLLVQWPDSWHAISAPHALQGAGVNPSNDGLTSLELKVTELSSSDSELGSEGESEDWDAASVCSGGFVCACSKPDECFTLLGEDTDCVPNGRTLIPDGLVQLEPEWGVQELLVAPPLAAIDGRSASEMFVGARRELRRHASVPFLALVSTRAKMHSTLQKRPLSAVVSDWQMKWSWDRVLDKVAELNQRLAEKGVNAAGPGGEERGTGGVVAQWWKGVRRLEADGGLGWRVLENGSWEVWRWVLMSSA